MKTCTWCGKEYSDDVTACVLDGRELLPMKSEEAASNPLKRPVADGQRLPTLPLGVSETDNGRCLVWNCPRCGEFGAFHAVENRGGNTRSGVADAEPVGWIELRCCGCKFRIRVDMSEREALLGLRDLTRRLDRGDLNREQYQNILLKYPAQFVKELAALTQERKCPQCGETCPVTFTQCWNCSAALSGPAAHLEPARPSAL
jgi:hypothetical protein